MQTCERIMEIVKGRLPAALVLKNGRLVNVFSSEIYEADIAVDEGKIVALGRFRGEKEVDLNKKLVCPGFIDSHLHVESSLVTIPEFTRAVVPLGTTTIVIDPHEIANVMGLDGIKYMLKTSKYQPISVYVMIPSCVPASHLETSGSELRALDLFPYVTQEWILGLGEMMNFPGVLGCDSDLVGKIKLFEGKKIDGHAPGLSGADLCGYIAMGIESDHECTEVEEAREKLRLGMTIMLREGGTAKNLQALLPLVNPGNLNRFTFCTDDRSPSDLLREGHVNFMIKKAIRLGLDPVSAVKTATINSAQYFGLKDTGAIAPGYVADLTVIDDFDSFNIVQVYKSGVLVAENGKMVSAPPARDRKEILRGSINIHWLKESHFDILSAGRRCRLIELIPGQIITRGVVIEPAVIDGKVVADPKSDVLKLAVVERHLASGNVGLGLVRGFGLKKGALASSVAHDSHNIIVVGTNNADMLEAVVKIRKMQGGFTVVADGQLIGKLPLPIAGLMSDRSLEEVQAELEKINSVAHSLGVTIPDPFMVLSFLALPVIPELKLTDRGLVDVNKFEIVELCVK